MQQQYKDDLHLLMWIASFVLLIACANLANLMLSRSVTQRQQIAVLAALGASRTRLVQRALVECVLLALLGGAAGLAVAWGGARLILRLAFQHDPISISASPSPVVMAFAFAASLLTGLLFGVAPAWFAAHADPIEALRGAHRSTGRHTTFAQKGLVVAQAAVSVVLLCAAGFLILSLQKLEHQHFGFEAAHRSIVQINAQSAGLRPISSTASIAGSTNRSPPFRASRMSRGPCGARWTATTAATMCSSKGSPRRRPART